MHTLIIFGASGDLTSRKLIPAVYQLFRKKRLPAGMKIVGVSRTPYSDDAWRDELREKMPQFLKNDFRQDIWDAFAPMLHYFPGNATHDEDFWRLERKLTELEERQNSLRVYYFATSPVLYGPLSEKLANTPTVQTQRLVIEKPFGTDLATAAALNETLHRRFREDQIFRIDHYLGKETAQNLMVLRFANAIFEPLWNRNHISNIQITATEETLVGYRAPYYENAGVLRDMFQNHLLQLLTLVAMEPPARFEANAVRDEKVKVLRSVRVMEEPAEILKNTLRGQYDGYLTTPNVAPDSRVATFGAVRLMIDNWRWSGVPFYLRSGKGMSCQTTQIVIHFHRPPHMLFDHTNDCESCFSANRLLIQIQPAEGIQIHFQTKVPDTDMQIRQTELKFDFASSFQGELPEAYQRLILDALNGDASLFARSDEVESAWRIIDPIQAVWDDTTTPRPYPYEIGTWGPADSTTWMESFGQEWFDACPVIKTA